MAYFLVQPYDDGRYRFERATVVGEHAAADDTFAALEW